MVIVALGLTDVKVDIRNGQNENTGSSIEKSYSISQTLFTIIINDGVQDKKSLV